MKSLFIRCSSLKGILTCPSFGLTDKPWNPESAPSQQGSAGHLAAQYYIESEGEVPDFPEIQLKYPLIDIKDLEICFWQFKRMWDENLAPFMGENIECEVKMKARLGAVKIDGEETEVFLTGHADIIAQTAMDLIIYDWKFGRALGTSHFSQTAGYAALAVTVYGWPESGVVTAGEAYPRFGKWKDHTQKIDKVYLTQFKETVLETVKHRGKVRSPSPDGCKFCSARLDCPEYPRMFQDSFIAVKGIVEGDPSVVDPEELAHLHSAYKTLEYACSSFKKLFAVSLETANAVGKENAIEGFYLQEKTRRSVEPQAAWPHLAKILSQDEIAAVLSMPFAKVKNAVMNKTPEGMKKKEFWAEFEKALNDSDSIIESSSLSVTKK
jgi:hypothetical protein